MQSYLEVYNHEGKAPPTTTTTLRTKKEKKEKKLSKWKEKRKTGGKRPGGLY